MKERPDTMVWDAKATIVVSSLIALGGCADLVPRDTESMLHNGLKRSEVFGFLAGLGTTFAAIPDLIAMLKRRSSAGISPKMAAIMGAFQVLWVYYGLLIASRPVIVWNVIAVVINFITVAAYYHYARREKLMRGLPAPELESGSRRKISHDVR
jgi:MtN3 and saliva related transmembrane protein